MALVVFFKKAVCFTKDIEIIHAFMQMLIWCYSNTQHRKPRRVFIYIIVWIKVAPRIQLRPHTLRAKHYAHIMQQKPFRLLKVANSRKENGSREKLYELVKATH